MSEWKPPPHDFKKLSKNVYYLTKSDHDRPVVGVIISKKGTILVDAGNSVHHASVLMQHLQELSKEREVPAIRYIILTHWHWDHSFGAHGYFNPELATYPPILLAHKETRSKLIVQQSYSFTKSDLDDRVKNGLEIEFIRKHILEEYTNPEEIVVSLPELSFQNSLLLDLENIMIEIEHIGGDHSADSIVIRASDDDSQILFLGDCIYPNLYNVWDYNIPKIRSVIAKLRKLKSNYYVDSHDAPFISEDFNSLLDDFDLIISYLETNETKPIPHEGSNIEFLDLCSELAEELYNLLSDKFVKRFSSSNLSIEEWREFQVFIIKSMLSGLNSKN